MFKHIQLVVLALCALLVLPAAAQVPNYVPTDGLVGWWPFNGNANDESGNGNDGVVNGATLTEDRFGNIESAYGFNGDFQNISKANFAINNGSVSISFWFKAENINNTMRIVTQDWNGNQGAFSTHLDQQSLVFGYFGFVTRDNSNTQYHLWNTNTTAPGGWHFIAATASGEMNMLYLDGVLIDSIISPNLKSSVSTLFFGGDNSYPFNGSLDDIAIYNRALTEQEIQNLYTGTTPPPCVSLPSNLQQGLVGYWPFCGNANDESGNGNDGVVNGATLTEDRFGNAGAAYGFDGVDDFIEVQDNALLRPEIISLSCWVNQLASDTMQLIYKGDPANADNEMYAINSRYSFGFKSNSNCIPGVGWQICYSQNDNSLSNWKHLVGTFDGNTLKLYVNNNLVQTESYSGVIDNCALGSLLFGKSWDEEPYFLNGALDDIGIWNRALTPEEVQELYTLDACTFTVYDTLTVYETVYDTVYTYETIYDTVTTYVTVTDTLLIDITITGFEGQPSWLNTVTVFPNPASDHITIDYGNFALMAGYNTIITDAAGATVYSSEVNSQQVEIDINAWGAMGVYYMSVYDANGALVAVRHIVLE